MADGNESQIKFYRDAIGFVPCNLIQSRVSDFEVQPGGPECDQARDENGVPRLTERLNPEGAQNVLFQECLTNCPVLALTLARLNRVNVNGIPPSLISPT